MGIVICNKIRQRAPNLESENIVIRGRAPSNFVTGHSTDWNQQYSPTWQTVFTYENTVLLPDVYISDVVVCLLFYFRSASKAFWELKTIRNVMKCTLNCILAVQAAKKWLKSWIFEEKRSNLTWKIGNVNVCLLPFRVPPPPSSGNCRLQRSSEIVEFYPVLVPKRDNKGRVKLKWGKHIPSKKMAPPKNWKNKVRTKLNDLNWL